MLVVKILDISKKQSQKKGKTTNKLIFLQSDSLKRLKWKENMDVSNKVLAGFATLQEA